MKFCENALIHFSSTKLTCLTFGTLINLLRNCVFQQKNCEKSPVQYWFIFGQHKVFIHREMARGHAGLNQRLNLRAWLKVVANGLWLKWREKKGAAVLLEGKCEVTKFNRAGHIRHQCR
jgi:hypothetical protein